MPFTCGPRTELKTNRYLALGGREGGLGGSGGLTGGDGGDGGRGGGKGFGGACGSGGGSGGRSGGDGVLGGASGRGELDGISGGSGGSEGKGGGHSASDGTTEGKSKPTPKSLYHVSPEAGAGLTEILATSVHTPQEPLASILQVTGSRLRWSPIEVCRLYVAMVAFTTSSTTDCWGVDRLKLLSNHLVSDRVSNRKATSSLNLVDPPGFEYMSGTILAPSVSVSLSCARDIPSALFGLLAAVNTNLNDEVSCPHVASNAQEHKSRR